MKLSLPRSQGNGETFRVETDQTIRVETAKYYCDCLKERLKTDQDMLDSPLLRDQLFLPDGTKVVETEMSGSSTSPIEFTAVRGGWLLT